ncbi:hypothetical protein [Anaerophaga thermohalophila]|uniref:hypothetical protein n=1 Tax=Anaerophaga thermohalophila TaxID=177400 RepID=UPI0004924DD1|nr:hypothetical protein [Anaerophaga thermohalophila]
MEQVERDIEGQLRPQNGRDVGCDQTSDDLVINKPLFKGDVGANYFNSTSVEKSQVDDIKVISGFDEVTIVFPSNETRDVCVWTIDGRKIRQIYSNDIACVFHNTKSYGLKIIAVKEKTRS